MYIYIYMCIYIYVYIYIHIEDSNTDSCCLLGIINPPFNIQKESNVPVKKTWCFYMPQWGLNIEAVSTCWRIIRPFLGVRLCCRVQRPVLRCHRGTMMLAFPQHLDTLVSWHILQRPKLCQVCVLIVMKPLGGSMRILKTEVEAATNYDMEWYGNLMNLNPISSIYSNLMKWKETREKSEN